MAPSKEEEQSTWIESGEQGGWSLGCTGAQFIGSGGSREVQWESRRGPLPEREGAHSRAPCAAAVFYSIISNLWRYNLIFYHQFCLFVLSPVGGAPKPRARLLVSRYKPKLGVAVRSPAATEGSCSFMVADIERDGQTFLQSTIINAEN
jgi:hypothetical protein